MTRSFGVVGLALAMMACRANPDDDGDGFRLDQDCDDTNTAVHEGAPEVCDGLDNDCDGVIDGDQATDASAWYLDFDGDGYGDGRFDERGCDAPAGYVNNADDCDDGDDAYHPGATEDDCTDPNDYNCDGSVGYADADGDGYPACEDCNDAERRVNPAAVEVCNGVDDDCSGVADDDAIDADTWFADVDGDGFGDPDNTTDACDLPQDHVADDSDCDDGNDRINPDANELCNGADDDCDGTVDEDDAIDAPTWYRDLDGDSYGGTNVTIEACEQPPGTTATADDCDDLEATTNPGATEYCDGEDDDCDGTVDEDDAADAPTWYADTDADGYGDPTDTDVACEAPSGYVAPGTDCDDDDDDVHPGADEYCNSIDDDCDGTIDESSAVDAATWYIDADRDGFGDTRYTTRGCSEPSGYVDNADDCNDLDGAINPDADDVCDGVDDDCTGTADDSPDYYGTGDTCAGTTCDDILSVNTGAGDGTYWIDPAASGTPFSVECDMTTDGGGWTEITGAILQSQAWVAFSIAGGTAGSGAIYDWGSTRGTIQLRPEGASSSTCASVALRATATLPFTFDEWFGSYSATGDAGYTHADDDSTGTGWGDVTDSSTCSGHSKFGTDADDQKSGGDWGNAWSYYYTSRTWSWAAETVTTTDTVRWEEMDNGPNEGVLFYDISLWLR